MKITQKMYCIFFYFIKLYEYWSNFQSSHETKIFDGTDNEVNPWKSNMSSRHMSDGQMYSFLQLFFQHWKN